MYVLYFKYRVFTGRSLAVRLLRLPFNFLSCHIHKHLHSMQAPQVTIVSAIVVVVVVVGAPPLPIICIWHIGGTWRSSTHISLKWQIKCCQFVTDNIGNLHISDVGNRREQNCEQLFAILLTRDKYKINQFHFQFTSSRYDDIISTLAD